MAQVKKPEILDAILRSACKQFASQGYMQTTLEKIAKRASVTTSNIYNYFPSKLDIFYAVYTPWLTQRLEQLEADVETIEEPQDKLRRVIETILRDLPVADNYFSNNLIQAVSTKPPEIPYSRSVLSESEERISALLRKILPESRQWVLADNLFPHLLFMAFDGFAMHARLSGGPEPRVEAVVDLLVCLLLGTAERPSRSCEERSRHSAEKQPVEMADA